MRKVTAILFMLYSIAAFSQDTLQGCLFLNFENIEDLDLMEGMEMSDQFEDQFGLTFSLEGGGFPVLAEIGGNPPAAYGSAWGNDTPNPQDAALVGSFFLTDDGVLAGLDSPPILLDFSNPIDSFAGCIMDMDFDEVFKIEAFDVTGAVVLQDSIMAGDPDTGDGRATCWGFNLGSCNGIVSQIKFSGYRTTAGAFGLGLDNFSFCYAGVAGTEEFFICESDSVEVNGEVYTETGIYEQELISSEGCDSLVYIDVQVYPEYDLVEDYSACSGEIIVVNGQSYDTSGSYVQSMQTAQGCDSTLNISIDFFETYEFVFEYNEFCEGDIIIIEGEEIVESGMYEFSYSSVNGCDSLIIAEVNILESVSDSVSYIICEGDSILVGELFYVEAGNYEQLVASDQGCDTLLSIEIRVNPSFQIMEEYTICDNENIVINGVEYTGEGMFTQNLQTVNSCDSIILLQINVNPTFETEEEYTICDNENIVINGVEYTEEGMFTQNLQTANSCDSIILLQINVNPIFETEEEYTFCENESLIINGVEYTQEGMFTQNLQTVNSCDSIITLQLNTLSTSEEYIFFTIFEGELISVNNEEYNTEGTYEQLLEASNGCDSLLVIELEVLPPNAEVFLEFEIGNCTSGTDLSEFVPTYPIDLGCGDVAASSLNAFSHSCTDGIDASGALCISSMAACMYEENSQNALRFNLRIEPESDQAMVITQLSFYEKAPESFQWSNGQTGLNNYPTQYGIRILKDNVEVYRQIGINTEREWNLEIFDLSGLTDFRVEEEALYQIELTPYCTNTNSLTVRAWDIDQISMEGYCSDVQTRVKGKIASAAKNEALSGVEIFIYDGENERVTISDTEGFYAFEELNAQDYHVRAIDDADHLEGVSTIDLILLQKHLLGIKPLEEAYLLIAGDINNSGNISGIDLIDLRKTLLGIHTDFPRNTSWRFFEQDKSDQSLLGQEEVIISGDALRSIDWHGVKIGDINNSISTLDNEQFENRSSKEFGIQLKQEVIDGQLYIHFIAMNNLKIDGFQLTCRIDNLQEHEIFNSTIGLKNSDLHFFDEGIKVVFASENIHLEKEQILFSIKIFSDSNVILDENEENVLYSADVLEEYDIQFNQFTESNVSTESVFENISTAPNPFREVATISFEHGLVEDGVLLIVDMYNRVIIEREVELVVGLNQIMLKDQELQHSGTYTLVLKSRTARAISKLIHIE